MLDRLSSSRSVAPREPSFPRLSPAQMAMIVTLISLTILFGASLIAYLVTRANSSAWRTVDLPPLPSGLFVSTLILAGVSFGMRGALGAVRKNRFTSLNRALWWTAACAGLFLVGQILNWRTMAAVALPQSAQTLYAFTFYTLTALHALHVLAGYVPLGVVLYRAQRRQYTSSRYEGVRLCAQYWDFLFVMWLVLLATLYLST